MTNMPQIEISVFSYVLHDAKNILTQCKMYFCSVNYKNTNIEVVVGSEVDVGTGKDSSELDLLVLSPSNKFCQLYVINFDKFLFLHGKTGII